MSPGIEKFGSAARWMFAARPMPDLSMPPCHTGIRVHHQRDRSKSLPDHLHRFHIPARFDLDLDSLVSGGELAIDLLRELVERILNPDRDARPDAAARAAERTRQRLAALARIEI